MLTKFENQNYAIKNTVKTRKVFPNFFHSKCEKIYLLEEVYDFE